MDGLNIQDIDLKDLRRQMAFVSQDVFYSMTPLRPTWLMEPAVPRKLIAARCMKLCKQPIWAELIQELPEGIDSEVGDNGNRLSGGQRQRIAIARAIVADPRVLVLDDATSAVDPTKEHEIRDALATVMRGRTTLVIAHRPATIELADRAVLLDNALLQQRALITSCWHLNDRYREVLAAMSHKAVE